jgi:hypothetical protein
MEILPGVGLPVARLGQTLRQIEAAVGSPSAVGARSAQWSRHVPPFAVYFDGRGLSRLLEVYAAEGSAEPVTLHGVQLTGRPMGDVVGELAGAGLQGRRRDLVADFPEGFMLWSLLERPDTRRHRADGPRRLGTGGALVEGVAIAGAGHWALTGLETG